jgi:pilus assembly protein Flp/PilA
MFFTKVYRKRLVIPNVIFYNPNITFESNIGLILKKGEKAMLFAPKEKGQGLVEYALILVLVAIVVIAVLMLLGPIIGNVFSTINDSLSSAT